MPSAPLEAPEVPAAAEAISNQHHLHFPASTTWPYGRERGVEPSGVRSSTPTSIPSILICTYREGSRVGAGKRMVEGPPATAIQLTRTLIVPYGRFAYGSRVLDREAVPLRHAAASGPDAFTVIGIDHFSTKKLIDTRRGEWAAFIVE